MALQLGTRVQHKEFGPGQLVKVLGRQAVVNFFGEELDVQLSDLTAEKEPVVEVESRVREGNRHLFRRCHESINLGVVPPEPDQLLALTIGGEVLASKTAKWLHDAPRKGFGKVVFGDYGQGKSHLLKVIGASALRAGWVVSFVEFDPKQADPAKPHLVYRAIANNLRFPSRKDGSRASGFFDFIGEVRLHWDKMVGTEYFAQSPWFEPALRTLRFHSHSSEDTEYVQAVDWLAGQPVPHSVIAGLSRGQRIAAPKAMPKSLETADIYVFHLVVVHELCQRLGYRGLLVILDEAEHVRGFSVTRRVRANNFFDFLACSAHPPLRGRPTPLSNEHGIALPTFLNKGPHFALVVALTEGATFSDPTASLREACVFLHSKDDVVRLSPPSVSDYREWCQKYFGQYVEHFGDGLSLPTDRPLRERLAEVLASEYERQAAPERNIRLWGKMAAFACASMMSKGVASTTDLEDLLRRVARDAAGEIQPWDQ